LVNILSISVLCNIVLYKFFCGSSKIFLYDIIYSMSFFVTLSYKIFNVLKL
jgi:hypothetical protein